MSDSELRERADRRFEHALQQSGARDPRDFYRERLRALRDRDPGAFDQALHYFDHQLVPRVATEQSDPLAEWLEYGRVLAQLLHPGETVQLDASGRRHPYRRPVPPDHLVLHLPTSTREPALAVGLPPQLSPAQRAAFELLVRQSLG